MKQYLHLLTEIVENGYSVPPAQRQEVGTIQINSHQFQCDLRYRFPLLTTKKMFTKGIIAELLWFLRGETNIKPLVDAGVNIWNKDAYSFYLRKCKEHSVEPKFTEETFIQWIKDEPYAFGWSGDNYKSGDLGPVYGKQWVNFNGVNQIAKLIEDIKTAVSSGYNDRRLIVSAWNPAELPDMALPPCHWAFEIILEPIPCESLEKDVISGFDMGGPWALCTVKENQPKHYLNLKWHQRSVDTFLGLPFNIASYAFLAHMIAQQTGTIAKTLIGDLSRVHIYESHLPQVKEQLKRVPYLLPKLELKKAKDIFSYTPEDFQVIDYVSQAPLKAEMVG